MLKINKLNKSQCSISQKLQQIKCQKPIRFQFDIFFKEVLIQLRSSYPLKIVCERGNLTTQTTVQPKLDGQTLRAIFNDQLSIQITLKQDILTKQFLKKNIKIRLLAETQKGWKKVGYMKLDLSEFANSQNETKIEDVKKFNGCIDPNALIKFSVKSKQIQPVSKENSINQNNYSLSTYNEEDSLTQSYKSDIKIKCGNNFKQVLSQQSQNIDHLLQKQQSFFKKRKFFEDKRQTLDYTRFQTNIKSTRNKSTGNHFKSFQSQFIKKSKTSKLFKSTQKENQLLSDIENKKSSIISANCRLLDLIQKLKDKLSNEQEQKNKLKTQLKKQTKQLQTKKDNEQKQKQSQEEKIQQLTLIKQDLDNKIVGLEEELRFNSQISKQLQKELKEIKNNHNMEIEVLEIQKEEFEQELEENSLKINQLNDLINDVELEKQKLKITLEEKDLTIQDLNTALQNQKDETQSHQEQINDLKIQLQQKEQKILTNQEKYESENEQQQKQIQESQEQIQQIKNLIKEQDFQTQQEQKELLKAVQFIQLQNEKLKQEKLKEIQVQQQQKSQIEKQSKINQQQQSQIEQNQKQIQTLQKEKQTLTQCMNKIKKEKETDLQNFKEIQDQLKQYQENNLKLQKQVQLKEEKAVNLQQIKKFEDEKQSLQNKLEIQKSISNVEKKEYKMKINLLIKQLRSKDMQVQKIEQKLQKASQQMKVFNQGIVKYQQMAKQYQFMKQRVNQYQEQNNQLISDINKLKNQQKSSKEIK